MADKSESKFISFRVEEEVLKKIAMIEEIKKESRSTILKESINHSFNSLVYSHINKQIYKILKKIFKNVEEEMNIILDGKSKNVTENSKKENQFPSAKGALLGRNLTLYRTDIKTYAHKSTRFPLNSIGVMLMPELDNCVKIKLEATLIQGTLDKIDSTILAKLTTKVLEHGFKFEAQKSQDTKAHYILTFELKSSQFELEKGLEVFKKNMVKVKKILEEISKDLKKMQRVKEETKKVNQFSSSEGINIQIN